MLTTPPLAEMFQKVAKLEVIIPHGDRPPLRNGWVPEQ